MSKHAKQIATATIVGVVLTIPPTDFTPAISAGVMTAVFVMANMIKALG